jgi:hypothetical protein
MCVLSSPITYFCSQYKKVTTKETPTKTRSHPDGGCQTSHNIWYLQYGTYIGLSRVCPGSILFCPVICRTLFLICSRLLRNWFPEWHQTSTRMLLGKCVKIWPRRPKKRWGLKESPRASKWCQNAARGTQNNAPGNLKIVYEPQRVLLALSNKRIWDIRC